MLKFGKIAKRYQKLPKVAKISQKWPPIYICPKLHKFAIVPKVAKGCQNMPEVAKR